MTTNYEKIYEKDYQALSRKYTNVNEKYKQINYEHRLLMKSYDNLVKELNAEKQKEQIEKEKYEKELQKRDKEIARLNALLNLDGTSAGIPTSKTPINKKKIIPNTRVKSDKKKGGQTGHKKHKLEKFNDNEINEDIFHKFDCCPYCNGKLEKTGEKCKDELSYDFVVIKRRHHFVNYVCSCCHKEVHKDIPTRLKEDNQYGSEIQSVALSLANEGNVSMNKIRHIIRGLSNGEIDMSEGYISKLQKKASEKLETFKKDLYKKLKELDKLYWDDTVIMINTLRGCLRFYGNENIAYYTAWEHKDEEGIKEDKILTTLDNKV